MTIGKKLGSTVIAIITCIVMVTGCNTFKGLGKDIEDAGKSIQKASDKTKDAINK